jgi:hypothetical protein
LRTLRDTKAILSIDQCLERLSIEAGDAEESSARIKALDTLLKAHGAYVTKTQDITDLRAQLQSLRPKMSPGAFRELIAALAGPASNVSDDTSATIQ